MTLDLTHLETLLAAATPGPWEIKENLGVDEYWGDWAKMGPLDIPGGVLNKDEQLLVALRNAAPALIARIREQEEIIEQAKGVFTEIDDVTDELDKAKARIKELEEALSHMAHQHHCGCKHPACRRCWDDETNFKLINEPQPERS